MLDAESWATGFYNFCIKIASNGQLIIMGVLIVSILIIAIGLIASKDSRENAKKWVPWVLVGTAAGLGCVTLAESIATMVQF